MGDRMGDGAFGEVRWCTHRETNSKRAVKIYRIDQFDSDKERQQMLSEIEILKTLVHPNIVRVFETFKDPNRFFIVMELCRGGELF